MKQKITLLFALLCASVMGWADPVVGSSTDNLDGQPGFTNAYDYSFSTSGTSVTISFTENDNREGLVAYLWNYTSGFAETAMTVSGHTASITLTGQTAGTTLDFACKFAFAGGMSVTKRFTYTVETTSGDPDPTPVGINWSDVSWLANGIGTGFDNKYKAVVTPAGMTINNLQTNASKNCIHVICPAADFGACSLAASDYHTVGAGLFIHLDAFTAQETEFTLVCQGTTYTFTVYYADGEPADLTGWNLARGKTSVAGKDAGGAFVPSSANDVNTDSRWASGSGAKHYAAVGNAAEDWWYVDLGDYYRVDLIKILFERANPSDYDLLISNNAVSWTVLGTYTTESKYGNTATDYNEYDFSANPKVGRYVKIFVRQGYSNLEWGVSMWEFEVYGDHGTLADTNPPSMTSASLSEGTTHDQVNIAVAGTDTEDGVVTQFHVVDASKGIDQACTAVAGIITVIGLTASTSYSFTITALDAAGNESENSIVVAATTTADITIPQTAAPTPSSTNKEVLPIYSDAFASILEHSFDKDGFAGMPLYMEKNFSGDNCLIYDRSGSAPTFTTWGMYDDGANAIIAQSAYRAEGKMGVDASAMENLHIDIWSLQACNTILVRINDGGRTGDLRLSHDGSGWKSYDIPLSEFVAGANVDNVRWFKFEAFDAITGKVAIDNVYFWKTVAGMASVSATPNNSTMGTATVKQNDVAVTEVTTGTEVTFSAVANEGYIFVDWSNGETAATFNATVNSSMNLIANFRALGTTYCNTEMTVGDHTAYVTMKRSAANEYKLIIRSNEELSTFGGTVLYKPENVLVVDLRDGGVLSDGNHTLTATIESDKDLYFGTPLYVVFAGVGEVTYPALTNIEYDVACDEAVSVESVVVAPNTATLMPNETIQLSASVLPAFAPNVSVTWSTNDESIASVDNTGLVTAHALGNAVITATSNADGTKYATCAVTVADALTPVTWYGATTFVARGELVGLNYSITRNGNRTLTYRATMSGDVLGIVMQVNDGVIYEETEYHGMGYNGTTRSGEWSSSGTTNTTYIEGTTHNFFFWLPYAEGVERVDVSYVVGSSNEAPNAFLSLQDAATDNPERIASFDNQVVDVIFSRTFPQTGEWYTLCLPFDMSSAQMAETFGAGYTLATLTGAEDRGSLIHLNFDYVRALEAGKPYLLRPGTAVTVAPVISSVTIQDIEPIQVGDEIMKFEGTFDQITLNSANQRFVGPENYLYSPADGGTEMDAFRCFFTIPSGSPAPGKMARIVFAPEIATGVDNVQSHNVQCTKVIENGQLFIIRDNRTYNAQGILVK